MPIDLTKKYIFKFVLVNTTTPGEVQSNLKELKRAMTDIDNISSSASAR
jgi:hypothetical protein